jgi:hypothetical protein
VPDFFEWGINCLVPSVFSNTDNGEAWPDGRTTWPDSADAETCAAHWPEEESCADETWEFSELGATPYTVGELEEVYATMHTELQFQMIRSTAQVPDENRGYFTAAAEYTEESSEKAPYGYAFEALDSFDPARPNREKFHFFSSAAHGLEGATFASPLSESSRVYTIGGYHAFVLPFFSTEYLPPQEGFSLECLEDNACTAYLHEHGFLAPEETHQTHDLNNMTVRWPEGRATPELRRHGEYQCVRTSLNGVWMRQVCDPAAKAAGDRLQGVVKTHVYAFWQELQDHHWVDFQTRYIAISLQVMKCPCLAEYICYATISLLAQHFVLQHLGLAEYFVLLPYLCMAQHFVLKYPGLAEYCVLEYPCMAEYFALEYPCLAEYFALEFPCLAEYFALEYPCLAAFFVMQYPY